MSFIAEISLVLAPVFALLYFITREERDIARGKDPAWQEQEQRLSELKEARRESLENEKKLKEQFKEERELKRKTLASHTTSNYKDWRKANANKTREQSNRSDDAHEKQSQLAEKRQDTKKRDSTTSEESYAPYTGGLIHYIGGKPHQWNGSKFEPLDPQKIR